jgi:hypothetical protein
MASASVIDRPLVQSSKGRFIARTEFSELTRMAGAPSVCLHLERCRRRCLRRSSGFGAKRCPLRRLGRFNCDPGERTASTPGRNADWDDGGGTTSGRSSVRRNCRRAVLPR